MVYDLLINVNKDNIIVFSCNAAYMDICRHIVNPFFTAEKEIQI